jgi:hypothetical protein
MGFAALVVIAAAQPAAQALMIDPNSPGWTLVRRADAVGGWHQATDSLAGTDVYGTAGTETSVGDFSVNFAAAVSDWDQIMFITGDRSRWMIMNRSEIYKSADNTPLQVLASFLNPDPYTCLMYNRSGNTEDPWFSAEDHSAAIENGTILYGEDGFYGWGHAANVLPEFNGANVFIRNSVAASAVPEVGASALLLGFAWLVLAGIRRSRLG